MRYLFLSLLLYSQFSMAQSERTILYEQATEFGYRNQFNEAEQVLSLIIALNPLDSSAYFDRAIMRENLGDTLGAIADFSKEISIDPKNADNYFLRGMLYQKMKKSSEALADFRKVNRLDGGNADAHFFAAQMYLTLNKSKSKIKKQLNICLKVNPSHTKAKDMLRDIQ
ncbi:MAG: tetratricopeptide repeat protein [Flavobacteriales bacterium]